MKKVRKFKFGEYFVLEVLDVEHQKILSFVVLFVMLSLICVSGCFGEQNSQYVAYMDTGEGTYMLFKLELENDKTDSFLYCISDESLGDKLSNSFRGYDQPEQHLNNNDIKKIKTVFLKAKSVKISLSSLKLQSNKISFVTKKIDVVDVLHGNFVFDGLKKGNLISGKMKISYSDEEYPQVIDIEFAQMN